MTPTATNPVMTPTPTPTPTQQQTGFPISAGTGNTRNAACNATYTDLYVALQQTQTDYNTAGGFGAITGYVLYTDFILTTTLTYPFAADNNPDSVNITSGGVVGTIQQPC